VVTRYVEDELTISVPVELVCQYHVSPPGTEPLRVSVTPASAHWGESEVGFPGSEGNALTVTVLVPLVPAHSLDGSFVVSVRVTVPE
jgi:hypothetical protein